MAAGKHNKGRSHIVLLAKERGALDGIFWKPTEGLVSLLHAWLPDNQRRLSLLPVKTLLGTTIQREDSPVDQVGSVWVLGSGD